MRAEDLHVANLLQMGTVDHDLPRCARGRRLGEPPTRRGLLDAVRAGRT